MLRRRLLVLLLSALSIIGFQATMSPAANAAPCVSRGSELGAGGILYPDQCLMSSNGRYGVKMHTNGSLALWDFQAPRLCWQSSQQWTPYAGDRMYFRANTVGDYTRSYIQLKASGTGSVHYAVGYDDYKPPTVQRSYSASINNYGQFWIGWDIHRSC